MQSGNGNGKGDEWFLLKTEIDGSPHFVGVMPCLPAEDERALFPVRVTVTVSYETTENGLPMYEDDLEALDGLEEDFRSWDPDETVFRNAIRSTGGGVRKWVLYASTVEEFEALVPDNDFIAIATAVDPEWSQVSDTLAGIRR
ncbi:MAG: hypothetical protein SF172_16410 [Burkholderiales bacterium]|nr:hypothetical protein [Burkholderiales bacterium]